MNPLSHLPPPSSVRFRGFEGYLPHLPPPPRVVFLTGAADHHGKTFLGLLLCEFYADLLPVEADNGARGEHDFGSIPGMEAVDFAHPTPGIALSSLLRSPGYRDRPLLVDNANQADAVKLAAIIAELGPEVRATILMVMEEGRPKFREFFSAHRTAIGANADWLVCRSQFRSAEPRFLDEEDWQNSPERTEYRRGGGAEFFLPVMHPRLVPRSYVLNTRLHVGQSENRLQRQNVWHWDRLRLRAYETHLKKTLLPHRQLLLTSPAAVLA